MSSIWSSAASAGAGSPFATTGTSPKPGGMTVARVQSAAKQPGLSPQGAKAANASPLDTSGTSGTSDPSSADTSAGLISANDFLSLLVTEMQNQDPTADTDPNAYVDQLVQINSLEQLININQNLSEVLGTAASTPTSGTSTSGTSSDATSSDAASKAAQTKVAAASKTASTPAANPNRVSIPISGGSAGAAPRFSSIAHAASGNLSVPSASAASQRVAHGLDGSSSKAGHGIRDIPLLQNRP